MKTVELIGAVCLLSNRAPAFGLVAPVMTVIVLSVRIPVWGDVSVRLRQ
jgi:hypothetical protein